jgi:hypothetical protein
VAALPRRDALSRSAVDPDPAGPRAGTVAAGAVAVVILVGAGAVALFGAGTPSSAPAATLTGPVAPATAPPAPGVDRAPSPAPAPMSAGAADDEPPLLVAPQVDWQLFGGVALPYSATAGPLQVDGPVYSGYERSQTGALIAAVQIANRYLFTPGELWRQVVERQVLPGVGRQVFIRNRAGAVADDPPGTYGQAAGFRFVAFTPDVASIQLVSRFPTTGNLQLVTVTVRWVDGDWRLQLQPDGGTSPTAQAVPDLDGFVVWGA